jgi:hypothetical protein
MLSLSSFSYSFFTVKAEEQTFSEGCVIGEYIGDPKLEEYANRREKLADRIYEATISENFDLATQLQAELNQLEINKIAEIDNTVQTDSITYTTRSSATLPSMYVIQNFYQTPQTKSYYCGPATAQMILQAIGITKTQSYLAGNNFLQTEIYCSTPWYLTDGSTSSQFVMATTLNNIQSYRYYTPSPLGNAGCNPLTVDQCKSKIMSTTSSGYGVALCGESKAGINEPSHLPGYPTNETIQHWLACRGYYGNGNYIWIVDPAYDGEGVSFANNINGTYAIQASQVQAFIAPRGMIW